MFYITFIYTVDTSEMWPLLIVAIVLIGHSLIMCALYIHLVLSQTTALVLSLHPSSYTPHTF